MSERAEAHGHEVSTSAPEAGVEWIWIVIVPATFFAALAAAYRPDFEGFGDVVLAVVPWVTAVGMLAALAGQLRPLPAGLGAVGVVLTLAGWSVLILSDDRWSILSFGVYVVCYSALPRRPYLGIALAGVASAVWVVAWLVVEQAGWVAVIPVAVFAVGATLSLSILRSAILNDQQRELIAELRATRLELAASERSKGALEERARMAGEIHDTLAQGFTSVVLLSRAAQRAGRDSGELAAIESVAQDNLDASRRLIDATRPLELQRGSLHDAITRHVAAAAGDVRAEFDVVGEPSSLPGAIEVTLLRAAQELTANVVAHAHAESMNVTLSYLDDVVALDVSDDGTGFSPGVVSDRGTLTGGQGLDTLARRAESLDGRLVIEAAEGQGSVLSVILPARDT